jgi:PAS domain S-box-containing protein
MTTKPTYEELEQRVKELSKETFDRKQAEAVVKASENIYKTLIENLSQKIFLKDKTSTYQICNLKFAKDIEIEPEEIRGKNDFDFFPKELADKYRADDSKIIDTGETSEIEEKYISKGQETWVNTIKTPIIDEDGNVQGVIGIFQDITERKRSEAELLLKDLVFEDSITANSISDNAGIITHVNDTFIRLWGYESRNKAIGKPINDFLKFEDEAKKIIAALGETGKWKGEYTGLRKDGTTFVAYGLAAVIKNRSGGSVGYQSAVLDITDRKQAERELQEKMNELETFYRATLGREERVVELKQEVNELLEQLGKNKKYRDYS